MLFCMTNNTNIMFTWLFQLLIGLHAATRSIDTMQVKQKCAISIDVFYSFFYFNFDWDIYYHNLHLIIIFLLVFNWCSKMVNVIYRLQKSPAHLFFLVQYQWFYIFTKCNLICECTTLIGLLCVSHGKSWIKSWQLLMMRAFSSPVLCCWKFAIKSISYFSRSILFSLLDLVRWYQNRVSSQPGTLRHGCLCIGMLELDEWFHQHCVQQVNRSWWFVAKFHDYQWWKDHAENDPNRPNRRHSPWQFCARDHLTMECLFYPNRPRKLRKIQMTINSIVQSK